MKLSLSVIRLRLSLLPLHAAAVAAALCVAAAAAAPAATITAVSANYDDVNNAVGSAADGDIVIIPNGTSTWSASLSLTKAITLQGAGTTSGVNLTQITRTTGGDIIDVSLTNNRPLRVTGIFFNCTDWVTAGSYQHAIHFTGKATSFRIDHCKFNLGKQVLFFIGWFNGVLDHCTFVNPSIALYYADVEPGDVKDGDHAWARPIVPGTTDCICVEDCTITHDNNAPGDNDEDLYCWSGGRVTWRHNTTTSTYSGPTVVIDAHGNYGNDNFYRSTIMYEVYQNTFDVQSTYRFCYLRGGRHLFWNNTFVNHAGGGTVIGLTWEGIGLTDTPDNIKNSYFWNNTLNGNPVDPAVMNGSPIILNTDYWIHAPQSGQTYYPYTPLVYPHPLVTGGGGPSPTVTPPPTPTPPPGSTPTPPPGSTPTPPPLGASFDATQGVITNPFAISGSGISQGTTTLDPTQGGRALYTFSVGTSGDYELSALVNCPDGGSNSLFVNIDAEPSTAMVWNIAVTSGSENRVATWSSATTPKIWTLNAGTHQLIIRGREADTFLQHITLGIAPNPPQGLHVAP